MTDVVLVNPGDRLQVFQALGAQTAAIEPPFWVAVIAAYLRNRGFSVAVIDANAESLSPEQVAGRVGTLDPRLVAVIVYGSQPSASTQNMPPAGRICRALQALHGPKVALGGLHPSALPERTLREECVDYVLDGEAVETIASLAQCLRCGDDDLSEVGGLWFRAEGAIQHTQRYPVVPDLDRILPQAAWDLLPMHLYRAHNWHCFDDLNKRQPYGAVYTSLGCPFRCVFCCINAPFGEPSIRFRSTPAVLDELGVLVRRYGVRNLKLVDELFVLRDDHYMPILRGILERGYELNMWAYARVDTVKPANLALMKKAGINWLALGIESADDRVREGASKRLQGHDVKGVVRQIQDAGIHVIGNYIFGLPQDSIDTMQATLDLALALNCEFANFYCAMAYPGSLLYRTALENRWPLPETWQGYSQHAYETLPLQTQHLTSAEVLAFRDNAFHVYFTNADYLAMLTRVFGAHVSAHMATIAAVPLRRRLLEPM